ncbi:Interleukin-5 [Camelus dromedarius]|uniref:Interleukin-5 n=1 Tax=Camelus dromedarius TaxID=9838 RepID=A0A5N4ED09_CAMDR|nr:Interleukin-5 [Camelus dromedarius]
MRLLLHLSLLGLGAAYVCVIAVESPMNRLVAETLTLLSTHRTLLIGDGNLMIPTPEHTNHQLCIEEVFQGIDTLKNQTEQGDAVEKLFQNLSLIKEYIDLQKELTVSYNACRLFFSQKKCGGERWQVKQFLDYLQVFLGVINTEWTTES